MKMAAPDLQERDDHNVLFQSLQKFFNVLCSESRKIVDDTHLDKVVDGLTDCGQDEGGTLRSLLDSATLNLPSVLARCIAHGDARVKSFGIRLFGVYAKTEEGFTALLAHLSSAVVSRDGHVGTSNPVATLADPAWWHEFLEDGGPSVQYTALGMLQSLSCHAAGWQWLECGKFAQSAVMLLATTSSYFVRKAAIGFLASVVLHSSHGNGVGSDGLSQLLSVLKRSLSAGTEQQPLVDKDVCNFQVVVSIVTTAVRLAGCTRPAGPHSARWLQGVLPSLSPLLESLKTRSEKDCRAVMNLLQSLDGERVLSLFPVSCPTQSPSEVVVLCCRGILLSPRREAGRAAHGLAAPELNLLIALELLRVFAGSNYPLDLRSQVMSEFVGVTVAVVDKTISGEAPETSFVLREAVPECTPRVLLPMIKCLKHMLEDSHDVICLLEPLPQPRLLRCVTKMAAHYQWTNMDDPPDASKTSLFQELLAVASLLLRWHTVEWHAEASSLQSLYSAVERTLTALIPSLTNMQLLSTCLRCLPRILAVCSEGHFLSTSAVPSACVVGVSTLPRLLEACMACEEWEVRDSCAECLGDLYQVLEGGGGRGKGEEEGVLSFLGVHKLVLSAVGDEDHNVRASGLAALSWLASSGRLVCPVTDFCAKNGISEAQLYQLVTELAVSDFSASVRVAAWQCLAAWHRGHAQVGISADTAQADVYSNASQVGVSYNTSQMGVSSSSIQVGMSSITTLSSTPDPSSNENGPLIFSALSEQQNALNTSKALMFSMSDEDHEVQTRAVQAAEQVLTVALGQIGSGPRCDCGGAVGDVIERVGSIDFDTFFTRNWEEVHISVAEQIHYSSEKLLRLLSTGCEVELRWPTEEAKVFYTSLKRILASTVEAVKSSAAFCEESPVDKLVSTLKEIVSAAEAEDSKFAEADCY